MSNTIFSCKRNTSQSIAQRMLNSASWLGCLTAMFLLICAGSAMAQLTGKGAVSGTVADKTGAVIPNATVTATNDATGITTNTTSTGAGAYHFSNLDAGIYTVTTTAQGFEKLSQKNIHVNSMETQDYDPVLTVGAANVEVTVTAEPPQLETSNATLGATMEQETYAELPIEMGAYGSADQRRATDFVYLMPGVQGNVTNGNATTNTGVVNGSGSKGAVSAVYIDGIPFVRAGGNGDPRYVWTAISVDAVDQFQVQTTGYSAVLEGQGVMNYTIKQGSAQQHGSIYEFFRNTALDTWGFFGKAPNPLTGVPIKPVEHSNEYGINLGGPLIPFGSWKQKLFYYGNYNGFRYTSATPTPMRFPTTLERAGDFSADGTKIYDPSSQATCTANSTNGPCRYQYGYGPGSGRGLAGNPMATGAAVNVIPASQFSSVAKALQSFIPPISTAGTGNNYVAPNPTGLVNWSMTDRIDYVVNSRDTLSFVAALGRQASSVPVGQNTAGRNVGPVPYNYGQAYAPKTAVGVIEETHVFSPHLVNQIKWGYARYDGPTFNSNQQTNYSATAMGITGMPAGQGQQTFPIVTFPTGTAAPTNWGGTTANVTVAANYTILDNLQWTVGKHAFTFGGQTAWMQYNVKNATGGTTPLTLATAVTETAGIDPTCAAACPAGTSGKYVVSPSTGLSYASLLVGQIDKGSFTQYLQQEFGARFRAISPYIQDNWKVNNKLTLDLGLRWDYFPSIREVHNAGSFFSPTLANPVTGINGALAFTGTGAGTINSASPVKNFKKNFGPRLGLAYQLDSKTVLRASYGVMFTHGNAVGGLATSLGTLGFSAAPTFSANGSLLSTMPFTGTNGAIPTYIAATGVASGPAYGTGYTTTANYTGTPSTIGYADPYLGGRAPEYINWSFGFQRQLTDTMTATATYVGSEGHFLQTDGGNARGYWADQLDPKYLSLGSALASTGSAATAACAANGLSCPANFNSSRPLSDALKPFPFQTVTDLFGYTANANYHALQLLLNMRAWHGFTVNTNYTWSRAIDDGGTFRTGYAIPAGTIANQPSASYKADRIERSVSTSNQPQHFVLTSVWALPFGRSILGQNAMERTILGGFKFSGIFQAFSGSPLAITATACQTNPAINSTTSCAPTLNPNFSGSARQNGKWGHGVTTGNYNSTSFIVPSVGSTTTPASGPFIAPAAPTKQQTTLLNTAAAPAYTFGNSPRTAPYNIYGPGNYQLDLAMVRSFPLHFTEAAKLNFRAEWYNVTNHTLFGVASAQVGAATFGQVTNSSIATRKAAQFSARIEF